MIATFIPVFIPIGGEGREVTWPEVLQAIGVVTLIVIGLVALVTVLRALIRCRHRVPPVEAGNVLASGLRREFEDGYRAAQSERREFERRLPTCQPWPPRRER